MKVSSDSDTAEFSTFKPGREPSHAAPTSRVQLDLGAQTHPGLTRSNNEDHYLVARFERSMHTLLTNLEPGQVPNHCSDAVYGMLVADGMGGRAAGEVASKEAIRILVELVLDTPDWIMSLEAPYLSVVQERMQRRFRRVGEAIAAQAQVDPGLKGMGTTMTLACSLGAEMLIVHVGDSRAYLFRQGRLQKLTHDHTMAQSLADSGRIEQEEVAGHPMRHVLTNVIGMKEDKVRVEIHQLHLVDGDQILLCSDGLTEMTPETDIGRVLNDSAKADDACNALVDLALAGGGRDNVTVLVGRYRIPAPK